MQDAAKVPPPARPLVEVGVLLFIALFGCELALSMLAEEPYPALLGPRFAGRPGKGGAVSAVSCTVRVHCAEEEVERSCAEFAQGASRVRSQVIVDRLLPADCGPRKPKPGIKGRVQERLGLPRDTRRCEPPSPGLETWLRKNAGAACDGPERLTVRREAVRFETATAARRTELLSQSEVDLGGGLRPTEGQSR